MSLGFRVSGLGFRVQGCGMVAQMDPQSTIYNLEGEALNPKPLWGCERVGAWSG